VTPEGETVEAHTSLRAARDFPLDEVLTISTGRLVARRHMDAVYDVLNFLTGDNLFTHQLPRALDSCLPAVLAQHPDLAAIEPVTVPADAEHIWPWLEAMEAKYGKTRALVPLAEWERRDPVEQACDMVGAEKVYVFPEATDGEQRHALHA